MEKEQTAEKTKFEDMSIPEKLEAVEKTIDEHIRPMLIMDGGNLEILDLKEGGGFTDVYIRYLGACAGCASSATGTLYAIETILKDKLSPSIRVLPI